MLFYSFPKVKKNLIFLILTIHTPRILNPYHFGLLMRFNIWLLKEKIEMRNFQNHDLGWTASGMLIWDEAFFQNRDPRYMGGWIIILINSILVISWSWMGIGRKMISAGRKTQMLVENYSPPICIWCPKRRNFTCFGRKIR